MQTVIDATQKETAIDQQQQLSCEMLIRQHHQTILWLFPSAATRMSELELEQRTNIKFLVVS